MSETRKLAIMVTDVVGYSRLAGADEDRTLARLRADHSVEFEVAEACLAHAVRNSVTRAYLRTTMVARRRKVMADRSAFLAARQ